MTLSIFQRRTQWKLLIAVTVTALILSGFTLLTSKASASEGPTFSWDRVPSAAVITLLRPMNESEIQFIAKNFSWVGLKMLPSPGKKAEESMRDAVSALKNANPDIKVLFYWNTLVYTPRYRTKVPFQLSQCRDESKAADTGATPCVRDRRKRIHYDRSSADFRKWWAETAAEAVKISGSDGVMADATGKRYDENVPDMLNRLQALLKPMGRDFIIFNGGSAGYPTLKEYSALDTTDGFIFERFDQFEVVGADNLKADMMAVDAAGKRGDIVLFKTWPGFEILDSDYLGDKRNRSPAALQKYRDTSSKARSAITFPLACFLVVAHPGTYFGYSWSYREPGGGTLLYKDAGLTVDSDWYPELQRRLGAPKADAKIDGYVFTRSFEYADVRVDLEAHEATIDWR